jgi:DNA-binding transcriptional LysR family regulator
MARFSGHIADVDLHLLRVFMNIADCGGISAAEHVLNVGRSTISRQLSDLEMRLGLRLCERGPAGFRLTNEGRTVLKHARDLMVSLEDFRRHLREVHCEIAGDLIIALSDATVPNPYFDLPHAIDMFLNEAPLACVSVRVMPPNEIETALWSRHCHVGLKPVHTERSGFHYESIYDEVDRLYFSCRHSFANSQAAPISIESIREHEIAALSYESGFLVPMSLLKVGPSSFANNLEGLLTLVLTGRFLAFLPDTYAAALVERGTLHAVNLPELEYRIPFQVMALEHEFDTIMVRLFLSCVDRSKVTMPSSAREMPATRRPMDSALSSSFTISTGAPTRLTYGRQASPSSVSPNYKP